MEDTKDKIVEAPEVTYADIHDRSLSDIARDPEPVETPPEAPKEEPEVVEEKPPQVNPEEIAERAAAKALELQESKRQEEKVEEVAPEKTDREKMQEYADEFAAKEGRNPTWLELAEQLKKDAVDELERRQQAKAQEQQAELEEQQAKQAEQDKNIMKLIDTELDDLYRLNKLPKIKDPNNDSDPGKVERKEFFAQWMKTNAERREKGLPEVVSASQMYYNYYKAPNTQVAGADAPILDSKGPMNSGAVERDIDYIKDIRGKSWHSFITKK